MCIHRYRGALCLFESTVWSYTVLNDCTARRPTFMYSDGWQFVVGTGRFRVCNVDGSAPDSAHVACCTLGFGGRAALQILPRFT